MTIEKPVHTIAGAFDRNRLKALKECIDGEEKDSVVNFEGQQLNVGFGQYLAEYVEGQFANRNHGGL